MEGRDTAEHPRDRSLAAEQRLLAEGIPAYLNAMMAIQELRQNIQKRCRRVLCDGLEEFAATIGMTLDTTQIEDYSYPEGISALATADEAWLGVKIPLQSTGTAYVTLVWSQGNGRDDQSPDINAYVAIELRDRSLFERVWEIVQREEPQVVSGYSRIIELYEPVPPDRIPRFDDILLELMEEWSRLWQRVGIPLGAA